MEKKQEIHKKKAGLGSGLDAIRKQESFCDWVS